jgi:hypothetical protein
MTTPEMIWEEILATHRRLIRLEAMLDRTMLSENRVETATQKLERAINRAAAKVAWRQQKFRFAKPRRA